MDNFFTAGQAIVEHAKAQDWGLKKVEFVKSLLHVRDSRQTTPSLYVTYEGYRVVDTTGEGERVKMAQKYAITLGVSNASSQTDVLAMIDDAGLLIPQIFKEFSGWRPTPKHSKLIPVGGNKAWLDTAFSYYPFTFETIFTL